MTEQLTCLVLDLNLETFCCCLDWWNRVLQFDKLCEFLTHMFVRILFSYGQSSVTIFCSNHVRKNLNQRLETTENFLNFGQVAPEKLQIQFSTNALFT